MNLENTQSVNSIWAGLIVEELVRNNVTLFCIAPGSRSTPLTIAAANNPKAETITHFDERGLAYYALGYASVTKRPAVLICTSGTAVANFFPAIIETSKKKLPLIILSADRPPELRDTGALQTIDQIKIYGNYTRWFSDLPVPDINIKPETLLTTIDQAVFRAQNPLPGPVHINCMFREPLEPISVNTGHGNYLDSLGQWKQNGEPYTRYTTGAATMDIAGDKQLISIINETKRGIIVVGKLRSQEEQDAVMALSEKLRWPVFPDIVSGLRFQKHENVIHYYHQVLLSDKFPQTFPIDTVLHLGGRITSKRFYQFIEKTNPKNYITVLAHSLRNDPLHRVTLRVKSTVGDFARSVSPHVRASEQEDHLYFLRGASWVAGNIIAGFTEDATEVDEMSIARTVSELIPQHHGLFLSNSLPIREMDSAGAVTGKNMPIGGNRGASGIDGIIASACGFAHALKSPVTLMTGDLAFLHDLNSTALIKNLEFPLIIVVINNDGGGIFSFLPIAKAAEKQTFETYFATPHGLDFAFVAKMFGMAYLVPRTMNTFKGIYESALAGKRSMIIEVKTNRDKNHERHMQLEEKIKKAMGNM